MSAPRIKRPYAGAASDPAQRQITSFFRKTSTDAAAADPPAFSAAALPASVQSNLLTVGMRVRKSVPEGYKTASAARLRPPGPTTHCRRQQRRPPARPRRRPSTRP